MGDQFLSIAGAGGNCARPMRLPNPSPVLDKNHAPKGPEIYPLLGLGVWRKAPMAFPDSISVLDKFQSANTFGGEESVCLKSLCVCVFFRPLERRKELDA